MGERPPQDDGPPPPPLPGAADRFAPGAEPSRTNTRYEVEPQSGEATRTQATSLLRQRERDAERRRPVAESARPRLMPSNAPPRVPTTRQAKPGTVEPIRPLPDPSRRSVGSPARESSDVIVTFDAPAADVEPGMVRPAKGTVAVEPPPPRPARGPGPTRARPRPPRPAPPAAPRGAAVGEAFFPLGGDALRTIVKRHRRSLAGLTSTARTLEIAAGIVGSGSVVLLIAAVVGIAVGDADRLLVALTLFAGLGGGALAALCVALAALVRQAVVGASQLAGLLEALTTPRTASAERGAARDTD
jgi:hypothetical protein